MTPGMGRAGEPKIPYGVVGALAHAMSVGGLARSAVPIVATFIISDLNLSPTQFGAAVTAMSGSVVLGVLVIGPLADRWGAHRVLAFRALGVAGGLLIVASASSYPWLVLGQVTTGLCVSGGVPSTNRLVATHVSPRYQGLALGVKQSGAQAGALIAGLLLPAVAAGIGWRWSAVAGAALVASTLLTLPWLMPKDRTPSSSNRPPPGSWRYVLASRQIRWLTLHGFLAGAGIGMVSNYVPLFAVQALELSPWVAGALVSVMSGTAVVARIMWGPLTHPSRLRVALALLSGGSIAATACIAAAEFAGPWLVWVGVVIAGCSMETWTSVGMIGAIASVRGTDLARASSMVMFGLMGGTAASPYVFSLLIDAWGYWAGWSLCGLVFVVASAMRYPRDAPPPSDDLPNPEATVSAP